MDKKIKKEPSDLVKTQQELLESIAKAMGVPKWTLEHGMNPDWTDVKEYVHVKDIEIWI